VSSKPLADHPVHAAHFVAQQLGDILAVRVVRQPGRPLGVNRVARA
jgi:hypothetical protein